MEQVCSTIDMPQDASELAASVSSRRSFLSGVAGDAICLLIETERELYVSVSVCRDISRDVCVCVSLSIVHSPYNRENII